MYCPSAVLFCCFLCQTVEGLKNLFCILDNLLGCFEDSPDRVLESVPHPLHINGRSQCASHCATLGSYRYFGLQVIVSNNSFLSYRFVCIYIILLVYLLLSYLKSVIGDITLVETKSFFDIDFLLILYVNNFLTIPLR